MHKSTYREKLSKIFASLAAVAFGVLAVTNTFLVSGSNPGIASIIFALKISVPSAFVLGFIGYALGSVFDNKPLRRHRPIVFSTASSNKTSPAHTIESFFTEDAVLDQLRTGEDDE